MGESWNLGGQLAWGGAAANSAVSDEEKAKDQHPGWFSNLHMHVTECACLYSYTGNTHTKTKLITY